MTRVYAKYRGHPNVSSLKRPRTYYAERLATAIDEDARLARGEVGYLDGDPVCQCQDTAGMRPTVGAVTMEGRDKARVAVSIAWDHDPPRPVTFTLVRTRAGWRIADVSSADEPSLLKALDKANAEARRRK